MISSAQIYTNDLNDRSQKQIEAQYNLLHDDYFSTTIMQGF